MIYFEELDEELRAFIRLRKAKEEGNQIGFEPRWAHEVMIAVNDLLSSYNIRFGNARLSEWKYISMETLLPGKGPKRHYAVLEAHFDDETPEYRLGIFNEKGKMYSEFTFFQIANQEIGLIPSLKAACGADNIRFRPPKESE